MSAIRISICCLLIGLLAGCQATRQFTFRPGAPAHAAGQPGQDSPRPDYFLAASTTPAPTAAHPPLTWVTRPTGIAAHRSVAGAAPDTARPRPVSPPGPAPAAGQAATPAKQLPSTVPSTVPRDPTTTAINIMGVLTMLTGAGVSRYALTKAQGEYYPLLLFLIGLLVAGIGIALTFAQGKNGRRRLQRQALRAAEQGTTPAEAEANRSFFARNLKLFAGAGLTLLGAVLTFGVLGLLGLLLGVVFFVTGLVLLLACLVNQL